LERAPEGADALIAANLRMLLREHGEHEAAERVVIDSLRAQMPVCPCGLDAITEAVGVVIVEHYVGDREATTRPAESAPRRFECAEGHWFFVGPDGPAYCNPPEEVTVRHDGPRPR
jgi:hypothetical protein